MRALEPSPGAGPTQRRAWRAVGTAAVFSLLFTLGIALIPPVQFAYRSPELHVALDTAVGLVALLAGYLLYGRFVVTRSLRDLVLAASLLVLGPTNLFLSAFPATLFGAGEQLYVWGAAGGRLAGALLFALSGFVGDRRVAAGGDRWKWALTAFALGAPLLAGGSLALLGIDPGVPPGLSPHSGTRPLLVGHPVLLVLQIAAAALYAIAAVGLARRVRETRDELLLWFAAGAVMSAFSRLNYFLFPSIYSEWVYTGDVLRVGAHILFLVGAAREIRAYWGKLGDLAVAEERRRVARELHDGLAQELALIVSYAQVLDDPDAIPGREPREVIRSASERALRQARAAISALATGRVEALDVAVTRAALEAADRFEAAVDLDLEEGISVPLNAVEMMSRVAGEAVTNASKHSRGSRIAVSLVRAGRSVVLRVQDDGVGFDPQTTTDGPGYGLVSMKERAQQLGAELRIVSRPGAGTLVEVALVA